ncbi:MULTISPECIES: hypothetical protein [Streptomyces]|uniref:hypothetical protein n=1 Tax=Streptomyces TaxID=1883 RepID=UPI001F1A3B12|nr:MULTISPECIES: hypothetical protein [Streptomyces]MDP9949197.1 hypothetical protein [Streptomyces sp. DSM 41269]
MAEASSASGAGRGGTGHAQGDAGQGALAAKVLAILAAAAAAGFVAGAVIGEDELNATAGLYSAAAAVLIVVVGMGAAWWLNHRRAARFGMSAGRYLRVGRLVQRGKAPNDPAEREAAVDIAVRMRRSTAFSNPRLLWWLMGIAALFMSLSAVMSFIDGAYLRGGWSMVVVGMFMVSPLTMKRSRRRLAAAERALGITAPA